MSHNAYKIGTDQPTNAGEITTTIYPEIRIGLTDTDNYSNSPASALNNSTLYFYDTSPVNTIPSATLTHTSNWYESVTLPSGNYLLEAAFGVVFTASGQFAFQWYDGTSVVGGRAQIGDNLQFSLEHNYCFTSAIINITSSTTFSVQSTSGSTNLDTIANQGTFPSLTSWIRIRKL